MKKLIITAVALVFSLASAMAQDLQKAKPKKSPDEKSARFTKRMTNELSLEATQQERVQAINLDKFKQIEEVKSIANLDAATRRQKMKQIDDNYFTTLKGVLNAEQFTKFQAMSAEIKEKAFARKRNK